MTGALQNALKRNSYFTALLVCVLAGMMVLCTSRRCPAKDGTLADPALRLEVGSAILSHDASDIAEAMRTLQQHTKGEYTILFEVGSGSMDDADHAGDIMHSMSSLLTLYRAMSLDERERVKPLVVADIQHYQREMNLFCRNTTLSLSTIRTGKSHALSESIRSLQRDLQSAADLLDSNTLIKPQETGNQSAK